MQSQNPFYDKLEYHKKGFYFTQNFHSSNLKLKPIANLKNKKLVDFNLLN